jgi:hypothetical protein
LSTCAQGRFMSASAAFAQIFGVLSCTARGAAAMIMALPGAKNMGFSALRLARAALISRMIIGH